MKTIGRKIILNQDEINEAIAFYLKTKLGKPVESNEIQLVYTFSQPHISAEYIDNQIDE